MNKKILTLCAILFLGVSTAQAQISLREIRNNPGSEQVEAGAKNTTNQQNYSSEELQKIKINNMAGMIIMNAAVVGYAKACSFNSQSIARVESYVINEYQMKNEPLVMGKFNEKVSEFQAKGVTPEECSIFLKEFNLILNEIG